MSRVQYAVHDLKHRSRGDIVEVTLTGSEANIRLMTSSDFSNYKAGRKFRCSGGRTRQSPVTLTIPSSGHWYVVVDTIGLRGTVRSSARILPPPMSILRQAPRSTPRHITQEHRASRSYPAVVDTVPTKATYDVFISHASEDKDDVARPLAEALGALDLDVWYDELAVRLGDSLRTKIAEGIGRSSYAVIILSEDYFRKGWTNHELGGIMARYIDRQQRILPIWHKLSKQQVLDFDPGLADIRASNTTEGTVEELAAEIADVIRSEVIE
jgi:hypothetical protein